MRLMLKRPLHFQQGSASWSKKRIQTSIFMLLVLWIPSCQPARASDEERPCVEQLPVLPRVPQCD